MKTRLTVTLSERDLENLSLRARRYGYGTASAMLKALCKLIASHPQSDVQSPDIAKDVREMFEEASNWEASPNNLLYKQAIKQRR